MRVCVALLLPLAAAFRPPLLAPRTRASVALRAQLEEGASAVQSDAVQVNSEKRDLRAVGVAVAAVLADFALPLQDAMAKGGEYGILEGKGIALIHPAIMFALLGTTVYTGIMGWNWRRIRTIGQEITNLKAQLPVLSDGKRADSPIKDTIARLEKQKEGAEAPTIATIDRDISTCNGAIALDEEILKLTDIRKDLTKGGAASVRDKHFTTSSVLLGWGVTFAIGACFNTYSRTGKLFPGPHLYAGAAITAMWALAAACVPEMQKGKEWARTLHIALNAGSFGLFLWQVQSGLGILDKVWTKVPWFP